MMFPYLLISCKIIERVKNYITANLHNSGLGMGRNNQTYSGQDLKYHQNPFWQEDLLQKVLYIQKAHIQLGQPIHLNLAQIFQDLKFFILQNN